jgi:predicted metalloprotease with PDZ domain
MTLYYEITPKSPHKHLFSVKISVLNPNPLGQVFKLPNWIPGSYLIRDFAKNIVTISATSEGKEIPIHKLDKNNWIVSPSNTRIDVEYEFYAFDLSVRSAYLTNERAFFNGTSAFLVPLGFEDSECEVRVNMPNKDLVIGDWQCATTLKLKNQNSNFITYTAETYHDLIDHPVEIADFKIIEFYAHQIPHKMTLTGIKCDVTERLKSDLISICEHHIRFFGDPIPFDNYLFLTLVRNKGYGGLEHKKSTSLICSREDIPEMGMTLVSPEYTKFLALCSHEYFHAWWIKTIKPFNFHDFDYDQENYTEQLWIFEGFTSYYDEISLLRTKILTPEQYLSLFSQNITKLKRCNGRFKQSIAESSFDAWTKFYKQDENATNSIVSYYSKGALLAFLLDIEIRIATKDSKTLDDIVRYIWDNFRDDGLQNDSVKLAIEKLTSKDFTKFFNSYVYGVKELPLEGAFKYVGIECNFTHKKNDLSGFGISTKDENGLSLVSHVFDNSSAQNAGVYVGDTIVSVDNLKVSYGDLVSNVDSKSLGDTITLEVLRDGTNIAIEVEIIDTEKTFCTLTIVSMQDPKTNYRQNKWFYHHS